MNTAISAHHSKGLKGKYPPYPAAPISDIRDMFLKTTQKYPDKIALQYKKAGFWKPITYSQLRIETEQTASGLAAIGLHPGDKLAILGDNRPEWAISYLAAACTGITCVPLDKDLKATEINNILRLSGAQAVICDDKHVGMILELRKQLPDLATVCNMDETQRIVGVADFTELKRLGQERINSGKNDFNEQKATADCLLSILFTSGTMGNSKGVMLTHGNVASNLVDAAKWVDLRTQDRFLSVLPLHHSYECTDGFLLAIYLGSTISYAENLRRIAENLAETHSTAVLGVPLLWHAVYKKIEAAMAAKGKWKVKMAKTAAEFSEKFLRINLRRMLFSKVHEKFGGSLRIMISGGAAIDPAVAKGFRELGIDFLQGYGLTESAPIIAVNRNRAFRDAAAGLPLPSVDVKIDENGEILARGPNIMKGYYNNPEGTRETLEGGWLHTGDLGYIDDDGFLYIQGRTKSAIVTPAGKKIYPEEVEAEILKSPFILECIVWGQTSNDPGHEPIVEAIVVPDRECLIAQGIEKECDYNAARVEEFLKKEVKERCHNLAPFKRVAKLTICHEELEKTTTKKIKRYIYTGASKKFNHEMHETHEIEKN
jgi:long-chain acyl-CoA synthetase